MLDRFLYYHNSFRSSTDRLNSNLYIQYKIWFLFSFGQILFKNLTNLEGFSLSDIEKTV